MALLAGGGCWALLNTDEDAAAVLLDNGEVQEEGGVEFIDNIEDHSLHR